MRTTFISCLLILMTNLSSQLVAQEFEWKAVVGGQAQDRFSDIVLMRNNGVIAVGSTQLPNGDDNAWIVLFDSSGNMINEYKYDQYLSSTAASILSRKDGGFIVAGTVWDDFAGTNLLLIRLDEAGDEVWVKDDLITSWGSFYTPIVEISNGDIITSGNGFINSSFTEGDSIGNLVVSIDENGAINWSRAIFPEEDYFEPRSIIETINGGIVVTGNVQLQNSQTKIFLSHLDSTGNVLWTRLYGSGQENHSSSVLQMSNGNFVVGGSIGNIGNILIGTILLVSENGDSLDSYRFGWNTFNSISPASENGFIATMYDRIARFDSSFNVLWEFQPGVTLLSILHISGSNYLCAGQSNNVGGFVGKIIVPPVSIVNFEPELYDVDSDGYAAGTVYGDESYHLEGASITEYRWVKEDSLIGTGPELILSLPTGTHNFSLAIEDEYGLTDTFQFSINILVTKILTDGPITSAISSIGDSLFFASSTDDKIYHFGADGNVRWSLSVGGDIQSTTTVGPNNRIYVGSSDTRLYAFNLNGNFDWDLSMGGVITASPALTTDDILYVGVNNGRLFSLNSSDGSINWNYLTDGPINSSASISDSGVVYFGSDDGKLYALNTDGTLKWSYATGGAVQSSPALDTLGNVFFGSDDGNLYAVNPSGTELWSYSTSGEINSSPVIGADGTVYFGSAGSSVYAVSSSGQLVWSYRSDSPVNGTGALSFNGILYIGTDNGKLLALSSTGDLLWYYQTAGAIIAPPLITVDNMIYVGSGDGAIYGMVDPNLLGLSKKSIVETSGQWPTFQQNNQRTGQRSGDVFGPVLSVALLANPIIGSYYDLYLFSDETLQTLPVVTLNDVAVAMTLESQVNDNVYHASVRVTQSGMNNISVTATDLVGNETVYESSFTFGKLAFNSDNRIVHNELGITFMVPGSHLMREGNLLLSSLDLSGSLNQLKKVYPSLNITAKHSEGDVFIIETNAVFSDEYKLSLAIKDNSTLSFFRLTGSGWQPITTYTDESHSSVWAYSSEPGIFGFLEGGDLTLVPTEFNLSDAFPNPFNLSTTIRYVVPVQGDFKEAHSSKVNLNIYNIRGQLVKKVISREQIPGTYEVSWNGTNESGRVIATGIYLMRLSVGDNISTKKLTVMK